MCCPGVPPPPPPPGVTSPAPVTGQVKEVSTGSRCTEEVRFLNYTVLLWLWSLVNIFERLDDRLNVEIAESACSKTPIIF